MSQELLTEVQERMLARNQQLQTENGEYQGPQMELTLASGAIYPLKGRVRFVNNQVDVKTGNVRVVGEFDNPPDRSCPECLSACGQW